MRPRKTGVNSVLGRRGDECAPLISGGAAIRAIKRIVDDVADTDATVLIRGERGVGKDFLARAIHEASGRGKRPFVKVNCAAPVLEPLEARLFGHEKGAFVGASRRKLGLFEYANKGTIYLDEVGNIPFALRAKLLDVLQISKFTRIGGQEGIPVDTRVIVSTTRNVETGRARDERREDQFSWLKAVEVHVPPLRECRDEIPLLVATFLARFNEQYRRKQGISQELLAKLTQHSWPGNVRDLEKVVRRIVLLGAGEDPWSGVVVS